MDEDLKAAVIKGGAIGLILGAVVHQFTGNANYIGYGLALGVGLGVVKAKTERLPQLAVRGSW